VTLAAPTATPFARLQALYAGLRKAGRKYGVVIVGGETSRSPGPLFLSIALTGWVEREHCIPRSGGKPGDALYVTGRLGGTLAGKHLDFQPRVDEARWLVSHVKVHAMMDLSDGLAADLPRLAAASRCGYEIDEKRLPLSPGCTPSQALGDGEDYELLLAVAPQSCPDLETAWQRRFPRLPLTRIGRLTTRTRGRKRNPIRGYDHFAQP
jgi:thiamine-monophosphate kinase